MGNLPRSFSPATHAQRVRQAMLALEPLQKQAATGRFRQRYHFMPPGGWLNDPNGCIHYGGQHHLFYQHNPYAPTWGNIHWGHATSDDLVHWQHQPIALAPSEPYDDDPDGGCFSGSAVALPGCGLALFYTAVRSGREGLVPTQCMATSADGIHFEKSPANPVVSSCPEGLSQDVRDPCVFRYGNAWYMVLGGSVGGARQGGEGCALLYQSADLTHWEYKGIIARSGGALGSMWECPCLFPLGGRWVLTFSPMFGDGQTSMYLVGDMDFNAPRFVPLHQGTIDWGGEYYAAQSYTDAEGRRILMAWQNGWEWMPWWKDFGPTAGEGWCGSMALPRTVAMDASGRLSFHPVKELEALRRPPCQTGPLCVDETPHAVPCIDPLCFEMELTLDLRATTASQLHIDLRLAGECRTRLCVDIANRTLLLDRSHADDGKSGDNRSCPLLLEEDQLTLRIFSDTTSIEVFTDGGYTTMCNSVYATVCAPELHLAAQGGTAHLPALTIWPLQA